ncbi:MAG TPA: hypothetical protein PLN54_02145 [Flavobacteriales bacterium]|nr:hypothetical protein [Flavobacteriales bacterium]
MRTTLACCAALLVSGQATAQVAECAAEWGLDSITTLMVEEMIQARLPEVQAQRAAGGGGPIFRIPVVFHIIHMGAGTPSNIPDLQVLDQLDHLNDEFRDNLDGFGDIPQIEFCLAQNTWDGQPWSAYNAVTPGITRWEDPIASAGNTMTVAEMFELVNVVQFPPDNYFNVWIVNEVGGTGLVGWAVTRHSRPLKRHWME